MTQYQPVHYCGEQALTRIEYQKLLDVCDDQEDKLLLMIGVSLGLRRSDIVRIMINNIDFQNNTLSYQEMKKKNRLRVVPLSPKLANELKIFIKLSGRKITDKLFSFRERQSWNRFNKLCDKAGIPRRPIHCLRATCCKFYLEAGLRPEQVAKIVGDRVETIMQHYTIPSSGELQQLVRDKEII
jgi:integrase